jgi:hypothetical protein
MTAIAPIPPRWQDLRAIHESCGHPLEDCDQTSPLHYWIRRLRLTAVRDRNGNIWYRRRD